MSAPHRRTGFARLCVATALLLCIASSALGSPDDVFSTGTVNQVLFDANNGGNLQLTYLGFSSGKLSESNPQRWYVTPFHVADPGDSLSWHISSIHAYGFTPAGVVNESLIYKIWKRTSLDAPPTGADPIEVEGSVPFPAPFDVPGGPSGEDHAIATDFFLEPGAYWLTVYADNASPPFPNPGAQAANFAWYTNAVDGIAIVDDVNGTHGWRSQTFPIPGFVFYQPPPTQLQQQAELDPELLFCTAFRIVGELIADEAQGSPADLNQDGVVDGADLAMLLGNWGPNGGVGDINGDGQTNGSDLAILLGNWGVTGPSNDLDGDGVIDVLDNCPENSNFSQLDSDDDGVGDVCDGCPDVYDPWNSAPFVAAMTANECAYCPSTDGVDMGDDDGDGVPNFCDCCPTIANADQADEDLDGFGDVCDNCVDVPNPLQHDDDEDGIGNTCDDDRDGDGVDDLVDNCPHSANADQADVDGDGVGDVCDNCPSAANTTQADADLDGVGDACDNCAEDNSLQLDEDLDGVGDACDPDDDDDGVLDDVDNCPLTSNADQLDSDEDGVGDVCETCHSEELRQFAAVTEVKLGGDTNGAGDGACYMVYVPTTYGARLTIKTSEGKIADLKDPAVKAFENGAETGTGKQGYFTFTVKGNATYTITTSLVEKRALKRMTDDNAANDVWNSWWWPWHDKKNPNRYDDPVNYGGSGPLGKYDRYAVNVAGGPNSARQYQLTKFFIAANKKESSAGQCDASSVAGFEVPRPNGAKTVKGTDGLKTKFVEEDRVGLTAMRYWVGLSTGNVDEASNDPRQLFEKKGDKLKADWFHTKLRTRIADDKCGMVVHLKKNWNPCAWGYESTYKADGVGDPANRKITLTTVLSFQDWSKDPAKNGGKDTVKSVYKLQFKANGTLATDGSTALAWPAAGDNTITGVFYPRSDADPLNVKTKRALLDDVIGN